VHCSVLNIGVFLVFTPQLIIAFPNPDPIAHPNSDRTRTITIGEEEFVTAKTKKSKILMYCCRLLVS